MALAQEKVPEAYLRELIAERNAEYPPLDFPARLKVGGGYVLGSDLVVKVGEGMYWGSDWLLSFPHGKVFW